ncbi:MAG TPA: hypothetical protein VGS19_29035 [Streptosporangiaceae bacterium]|nr:hypothetical protein [Streptosporangiaceae bacterium]
MTGAAIRLELDGLDHPAARFGATAVLVYVAEFCAQAETFPVFREWAAGELARLDAPASIRESFADLTPDVIGGFAGMLRAGWPDRNQNKTPVGDQE